MVTKTLSSFVVNQIHLGMFSNIAVEIIIFKQCNDSAAGGLCVLNAFQAQADVHFSCIIR